MRPMLNAVRETSRRAQLRRVSLSLFFAIGVAVNVFAVSWIVPADRFEIERASAIVIGRVLDNVAVP